MSQVVRELSKKYGKKLFNQEILVSVSAQLLSVFSGTMGLYPTLELPASSWFKRE
jgi:hypothetical protein